MNRNRQIAIWEELFRHNRSPSLDKIRNDSINFAENQTALPGFSEREELAKKVRSANGEYLRF